MQRQWLSRPGSATLTLVFGGWAVGAAAFTGLQGDGDVLLVSDYTRLEDPLPELQDYSHVDLIAFSFGVASAAHWMARTGFRPARQVAISGTLFPANTEKGIDPDLIRATADNLSEASFPKFCRRAGLNGPAPALDIPAAQAELHAIAERGSAPDMVFDRIWIPERDRVIPTAAQETAWAAQPAVIRRIPAPHIPFEPGQNWADWIR